MNFNVRFVIDVIAHIDQKEIFIKAPSGYGAVLFEGDEKRHVQKYSYANKGLDMKEYEAESIKILDGLDAVRKVPSMYIGNTNIEGLHHLVYELVDNSIDEALEGYCDTINVTIHRDNSVAVEDNGRGIPVALHKGENMSALEVVLTKLHAGGKFDKDSYKFSAGLHGVGLSVVNALSEYLEVEIRRGGKVYFQRYERGEKVSDLQVVGNTEKSGTKVRFRPDSTIFETIEFSHEILGQRMREISFLNNGIHIVLTDERKAKHLEFKHEGGIGAFVKYLNQNKAILFEEPIYISGLQSQASIRLRWRCSITTATTKTFTASLTTSTHTRAAHTWPAFEAP